jgi:hypothetical protein
MQAKVTQYSSFLLIQGLPDAGRRDPFPSLLLVKESVHAGREDPIFILLVIQRTSQEAEGTHFFIYHSFDPGASHAGRRDPFSSFLLI